MSYTPENIEAQVERLKQMPLGDLLGMGTRALSIAVEKIDADHDMRNDPRADKVRIAVSIMHEMFGDAFAEIVKRN